MNTSPFLAAKHFTWVLEQRAVCTQFCEGLVQNETVELQVIPQFVSSSGLPRTSLREMCGVADVEMKSTLSLDGFCLSRRFIGYCLAMRDDQAKRRALTRWPIGGSIIECVTPKIQKNGPRSVTECFSLNKYVGAGQPGCRTSLNKANQKTHRGRRRLWVGGWMGPTQQTTGTSETRQPWSFSEING